MALTSISRLQKPKMAQGARLSALLMSGPSSRAKLLGHSGIGPFTFPAGTFEDIQVTVEAQSSGADGTVCPSTDAFVFTMTDNPEFADLPLDWLVCRDGELALEDNGVTSPNGSLVYSWNDTSVPQVFDIETDDPFASAATLSVQSVSAPPRKVK